jgi:hypothetical protein
MSWIITATEHNEFVFGRQQLQVNYGIQLFREQLHCRHHHHHQVYSEVEYRVISHHSDDGDGVGLRKLDFIIHQTWLFAQENFRPIKLVVFGHNGESISVDSCKPSVEICETAYQCCEIYRTICSIDSSRTSNLVKFYILLTVHLDTGQKGTFWPAYQTVTYTECYIPDDVLIQLILLMMSTVLLETCREVK